MHVIIGVDPHKASHQAVAVDDREAETARISVRATRTQTNVCWRGQRRSRVATGRSRVLTGWAICWRSSSSRLASEWLMCRQRWRRGHVCSVRPLEQDRPERCVVGRRRRRCGTRSLREVRRAGTPSCCGCWRSATPTSATSAAGWCRGCIRCWSSSHRAGSPRKSTLLTSTRSLARLSPTTPVEQLRYELAVELLDDIRRLDDQLKASHKRIACRCAGIGHERH